MSFRKKFVFHYKSRETLQGYALRRKSYRDLVKDFPVFEDNIKVKFFDVYLKHIYWPLIKLKNLEI